MPWYVNPLFAQAVEQEPAGIPWYLHLLVALAAVFVSFFLGNYLGKKLRMPDHGWKIGLILFCLLSSVAILLMGPPLKLGIDLRGGALLVYEVDQTKKRADQAVNMDDLIDAIKRRVNPGGQKEVTIRKYGIEQIEVIVPEVDEAEVQRIERLITTTGNLQFRILANNRQDKDLIELALADTKRTKFLDASGKLTAWWVPVKLEEEESLEGIPGIALRKKKKGEREITEVLVVTDKYNVTGAYLVDARSSSDDRGRPSVSFTFDEEGGRRFGELTGDHLPDEQTGFTYKLGIILDDELYSAPQLNSIIYRRGEISGNFTPEEVDDLVNVLKAGSLPAALSKEPISKLFSGPTLGQDTITKSTNAMIIAAILVPLFMLWYYRFCGIVADFALLLNILILFAIMLSVNAVFTLTSFAGLALTIGMAVDNNVLVFERLREELARGAALRMAIRNAFQRASTTIIDANLTTLIAATVLYVIGTDQVKGFAVPLFIGMTVSMFTSIFVSRVIFDVAEKRRWITEVKMLRLIGRTNIDFLRIFPITATMSLLIIVMAVAASIHRGKGLFDIDFTGGVSVQALFNQPEKTDEVRKLLSDRPESERLHDLAVSDVYLEGEERGKRFMLNTSEMDIEKVKHELTQVFGDKLVRNSLEFTPLEIISSDGEAAPLPDKAPDAKPAEPPERDQSRLDLPPRTMLAFAGGDALALMLADDSKEPSAGKPAATERQPLASPDQFAGGVRTQLTFKLPVNYQAVEQYLGTVLDKAGLSLESVSYEISNDEYAEGESKKYPQWTLKIMLQPKQVDSLLESMKTYLAENPNFPASNRIGKTVAGNTQLLAIYALTTSWLFIIFYLWIRFQGVAFGLAAVAALIHDVFIVLGAVAASIYVAPYLGFLMIEPLKINLPIVAAFLTIIGFSVNDTIVIFDRVREVRGKAPHITREMINLSTNQTLSRTLLTSFTSLLVIVVLYICGGEAIHGFAFALIVGVLTGTYSSVYVASPILLWLVGKREPGKSKKQSATADPRKTNLPSRRL
jgi:SecD/SecF fusion protein